jgi:hypothetical protein
MLAQCSTLGAMADETGAPELRMDPTSLYREDTYTDRRIGTIRVLTPVTPEGSTDLGRPVLYVGETQLLTTGGLLPLVFEIEARSLSEAVDNFSVARPRRRSSSPTACPAASAAPASVARGWAGPAAASSARADALGSGPRRPHLDEPAPAVALLDIPGHQGQVEIGRDGEIDRVRAPDAQPPGQSGGRAPEDVVNGASSARRPRRGSPVRRATAPATSGSSRVGATTSPPSATCAASQRRLAS